VAQAEVGAAAQEGKMKIGHISDFHLRHHLSGTAAVPTRLSRQMPMLLERAVERLAAEDLDWLAVTGDLVDHPFADMDGRENRERGEADLRLIRDILAQMPCPLVVVYGNHDHPELFRRVFGANEEVLELAGHRVFCFFDEEGAGHVPERVGRARWRFNSALADGDTRPQVHLQHYLIHPERNEGYPHNYGEAAALKRALEQSGKVRLVLAGHYHSGVELCGENGIYYAVAPAFCEAPHAFHIYEWDGEQMRVMEHKLCDTQK
jgi:3',5'-cyclic AMP phosphodiesterase CpdA